MKKGIKSGEALWPAGGHRVLNRLSKLSESEADDKSIQKH
jgi:hypothetical protein